MPAHTEIHRARWIKNHLNFRATINPHHLYRYSIYDDGQMFAVRAWSIRVG